MLRWVGPVGPVGPDDTAEIRELDQSSSAGWIRCDQLREVLPCGLAVDIRAELRLKLMRRLWRPAPAHSRDLGTVFTRWSDPRNETPIRPDQKAVRAFNDLLGESQYGELTEGQVAIFWQLCFGCRFERDFLGYTA
ncbi:MAG TPA: hypothetical protein VLI05_05365 [Candidatus Saccharimonadia bacterium]|nr:hypothetical protein [Candidatus Saccharimonadia bacterium]